MHCSYGEKSFVMIVHLDCIFAPAGQYVGSQDISGNSLCPVGVTPDEMPNHNPNMFLLLSKRRDQDFL